MAWVTPWRVSPPTNKTFLARFGATICFCARSKWTNKWFMVLPGGGETEMCEPDMWHCADEDYARTHQREGLAPARARVSLRPLKKPQQLSLF